MPIEQLAGTSNLRETRGAAPAVAQHGALERCIRGHLDCSGASAGSVIERILPIGFFLRAGRALAISTETLPRTWRWPAPRPWCSQKTEALVVISPLRRAR
jgi:hypothetical protein